MTSRHGDRGLRALVAGLTLLAIPHAVSAATHLEATGEAGADLHLVVRNTGDEAARAVTPRLVYQHRTAAGDTGTLEPGASREWRIPLPPPPGPGTFPATIRIEHVDAAGRTGSVPLVVLVPTSAPASSAVRASLDLGPFAGVAHGKLVLDNTGGRPVAGRVVFVLPGGTWTEPESLPVQIPAGGRTIVPLAIQARGAVVPGRYPAYAVFEYVDDAEHRTVLATADVVAEAGRSRRARPLLVGLGALGVTFALLGVAWRRAARRT
jgi:hypothetical protein